MEYASTGLIDRIARRAVMLGDVAVVSVPEESKGLAPSIAEAIIKGHRKVRTVLNKDSLVSGDARVPHYELLLGEDTVAHYHENGFVYEFDVRAVFFNSRMGFEHRRIASLASTGEKVLLPFSGAGPFAIPLAASGCSVLAIDNSRDACRWLARNAALNHVESSINILRADALRVPLSDTFDRAVVPAPYGMDEALGAARDLVKTGGRIHFYTFKKKRQLPGLAESYGKMGLEVERYRDCGNVAHDVKRWAFDLVKS